MLLAAVICCYYQRAQNCIRHARDIKVIINATVAISG